MVLTSVIVAALGFAPGLHVRPSVRGARGEARMGTLPLAPLDAAFSPLQKWAAPPTAGGAPSAAAAGSLLDGLPLEVVALFGVIAFVGVAGLVRQSGVLSTLAPTLGLGDTRESLSEEAATAMDEADEDANLSQGEQEKKYFAVLAEEAKQKRGGSSSKRKKTKR